MSLVEMQQDQYLAMFTSSIKLLTVSLFHFHSVLRGKKRQLKLFCNDYIIFKVPNTLKMKLCTSLLLRNTVAAASVAGLFPPEICCCHRLVSKHAAYAETLTELSCFADFASRRRCHRLQLCCITSTLRQSLFFQCGPHITCKSTREMTPPAAPPPPTSLCRFFNHPCAFWRCSAERNRQIAGCALVVR